MIEKGVAIALRVSGVVQTSCAQNRDLIYFPIPKKDLISGRVGFSGKVITDYCRPQSSEDGNDDDGEGGDDDDDGDDGESDDQCVHETGCWKYEYGELILCDSEFKDPPCNEDCPKCPEPKTSVQSEAG